MNRTVIKLLLPGLGGIFGLVHGMTGKEASLESFYQGLNDAFLGFVIGAVLDLWFSNAVRTDWPSRLNDVLTNHEVGGRFANLASEISLVGEKKDRHSRRVMQTLLKETSLRFQQLRTGRLEFNLDLELDAYRESIGSAAANVSYDVTAAVDSSYWSSRAGRLTVSSNIGALNRGVRIRRIFIARSDDLTEVTRIASEHASLGIETYVLDSVDVPPGFDIDFALIDDKEMGIRLNLDLSRHAQGCVLLFSDSAEGSQSIELLRSVFEQLLPISRRVSRPE